MGAAGQWTMRLGFKTLDIRLGFRRVMRNRGAMDYFGPPGQCGSCWAVDEAFRV